MTRRRKLTDRITVSFDASASDRLNALAEQQNVSVAWIVRHAVDLMLDGKDGENKPFFPWLGQERET